MSAAFETYLDKLKALSDYQRQSLARWSADVLAFAEMTDGIVWDGLLGWAANQWPNAPETVEALRSIGATAQADLLASAMDLARERGHVGKYGLDYKAAQNDGIANSAFLKAEASIEGDWESLWDRAEAYARSSGWSYGPWS
jgi:hypothetical protein